MSSSPPDLIVVSDLHLGEGLTQAPARFSPMEDFFYDEAFCRLLEHIEWSYHDPQRCVLILNGDVFDFLTVTRVPDKEEAKSLGFRVSGSERRFGLSPTPAKSLYKLDRIMDGHPAFFAGLARFVLRGFRIEILRGNHDLELYFEVIQRRFFERLCQLEPRLTIDTLREQVIFHQWYYHEPGRIFIEHGNQYEASNSIRYPLCPVLPERRRRKEGDLVLDYPLGSLFVRYFYNSVHRLTPHTPKVISFEQYLEFLRRHNLLDLLRIARDHWPFFTRAIGPTPSAGTSGPSAEGERKQKEDFETLERTSAEHDFHREIADLKIHPLAASKAALVKQMMKPLLRRVGWVGGITFVSIYVWLLLFAFIQDRTVIESVFAKAILLMVLGLGTATGLFWGANVISRRMRRQTDETVEMCADRADKIARLTGVKLVLMGHTHVVDVCPINDGRATYGNGGTWTSVDNPWDRLHPDARRFTLMKVTGDEVQVCRWNDDAGRIDPVPMFDMPEQRELDPAAIGLKRPPSLSSPRVVTSKEK